MNKILPLICLLFACAFVEAPVLANSAYVPPFYDVLVLPHSSITVSYDFNPNKQYLLCFSNRPNLVAAWRFDNAIKIGEIPVELKKENADSKGEMQIYNNTDEPYKMINCQYQST